MFEISRYRVNCWDCGDMIDVGDIVFQGDDDHNYCPDCVSLQPWYDPAVHGEYMGIDWYYQQAEEIDAMDRACCASCARNG